MEATAWDGAEAAAAALRASTLRPLTTQEGIAYIAPVPERHAYRYVGPGDRLLAACAALLRLPVPDTAVVAAEDGFRAWVAAQLAAPHAAALENVRATDLGLGRFLDRLRGEAKRRGSGKGGGAGAAGAAGSGSGLSGDSTSSPADGAADLNSGVATGISRAAFGQHVITCLATLRSAVILIGDARDSPTVPDAASPGALFALLRGTADGVHLPMTGQRPLKNFGFATVEEALARWDLLHLECWGGEGHFDSGEIDGTAVANGGAWCGDGGILASTGAAGGGAEDAGRVLPSALLSRLLLEAWIAVLMGISGEWYFLKTLLPEASAATVAETAATPVTDLPAVVGAGTIRCGKACESHSSEPVSSGAPSAGTFASFYRRPMASSLTLLWNEEIVGPSLRAFQARAGGSLRSHLECELSGMTVSKLSWKSILERLMHALGGNAGTAADGFFPPAARPAVSGRGPQLRASVRPSGVASEEFIAKAYAEQGKLYLQAGGGGGTGYRTSSGAASGGSPASVAGSGSPAAGVTGSAAAVPVPFSLPEVAALLHDGYPGNFLGCLDPGVCDFRYLCIKHLYGDSHLAALCPESADWPPAFRDFARNLLLYPLDFLPLAHLDYVAPWLVAMHRWLTWFSWVALGPDVQREALCHPVKLVGISPKKRGEIAAAPLRSAAGLAAGAAAVRSQPTATEEDDWDEGWGEPGAGGSGAGSASGGSSDFRGTVDATSGLPFFLSEAEFAARQAAEAAAADAKALWPRIPPAMLRELVAEAERRITVDSFGSSLTIPRLTWPA